MDIKVGDIEINEIWWEKKGWDRIKEAIEGKIFGLKNEKRILLIRDSSNQ